MAEVSASAVFANAAFASPLILEVVFASPAMFVAEAYMEPVTVVATAAFASPVHLTGAFGTPVCVTAGAVTSGECMRPSTPQRLQTRLGSAVFATAAFASLLLLPEVFASQAMVVIEAYVKPVTVFGSPVVATVAFANPMYVTGTFGTPVYP